MKRTTSVPSISHTIFESFQPLFSQDPEKIASKQEILRLSVFQPYQLISLCRMVSEIFSKEPNIVSIESPCIVVGDLHGHITDLIRIVKNNGFPKQTKYLFLGDIVDRGQFSLETLLIIFTFKVIWPANVVIIRGNHEFDFTCKSSGFLAEIKGIYRDYSQIYESFLDAFAQFPLGCIIDKNIFCVHGGIGPNFTKIEQLNFVKRPVHDFGYNILDEALWSDPNVQIADYEKSPRGTGYLYGFNAVNKFISENKIKAIVRGHENTMKGCEIIFDAKVFTVFSASNYCGVGGNEASILIIKEGEMKPVLMPPLSYLLRSQAQFIKLKN